MKFKNKRINENMPDGTGTEISVGLHIDSRSKTGIPVFLIRAAAAYFGSLGSVMCFVSALFPSVSVLPIALAAAAPVLLCFIASLMKRGGRFVVGGGVLITAAAGYFLREHIKYGFLSAANHYLSSVRTIYRNMDYFNISSYTGDIDKDRLILFCFAAAVIALVSAAFMVYRTGIIAVFAVTFPPVELVLYYGLVPDYIWAAAVIACWIASAAAEVAEYPVYGKDRRVPVYGRTSGQSAGTAALAVLLCFAISVVIVNVSGYERPEKMDDFKVKFSRYVKGFSWSKFVNDLSVLNPVNSDLSGAINHGKLGRTENVEFNNKTVLEVTAEKTGYNIYLKGFTGADYTGNSWKEISGDEADGLNDIVSSFRTMYLDPLVMDGYSWYEYGQTEYEPLKTTSITVNNVSANTTYAYIPYNITPNSSRNLTIRDDRVIPDGSRYSSDVYVLSPQLKNSLVMNRWFELRYQNFLTSEILYDDELAYREYAYENYLDIPETFTAARSIYGTSEFTDIGTELYNIKNWLSHHCEYDLNAGKLPFGEDFAQYFLTKTRKGSCSHFATAAVLMCRYRGIPARYCEGYIIKNSDFPDSVQVGETSMVNVTDKRAHAWIEVYIDGYGWYPYEMTPGYGDTEYFGTSAVDSEQQSAQEKQPAETSQAAVKEEEQTETEVTSEEIVTDTQPAETEAPVSESSPEQSIDNGSGEAPTHNGGSGKGISRAAVIIIAVILLIAAAVGVMWYRYRTVTKKRSSALNGRNSKLKAKTACRYFMQVCEVSGIVKTDDVTYDEFAARAAEETGRISRDDAVLIVRNGLEASFGNDQPDSEKSARAAEAAEKFAEKTYSELKPINKIYFRFIRCLK